MKTGILNEEPIVRQDETMLNFMSVFSLFTEDALVISSKYTQHSGRNVVVTDDIIYGLKTRFKHRSFYEQQENVLQRLNEIKTELTQDPDYDVFDDTETISTDDETSGSFIKSNCKCETCRMVNDTIQTWDNYLENNYESLSEADKSIIFAIKKAEEKMIELKNLSN